MSPSVMMSKDPVLSKTSVCRLPKDVVMPINLLSLSLGRGHPALAIQHVGCTGVAGQRIGDIVCCPCQGTASCPAKKLKLNYDYLFFIIFLEIIKFWRSFKQSRMPDGVAFFPFLNKCVKHTARRFFHAGQQVLLGRIDKLAS